MKKEEGFPGQISYVIPDRILSLVRENPLISDLYITDIGYYPQARHHFRERPTGSPQFILIYCVEGKGEIRVNESIYPIPENHFFIIPKGTPHAYRANENNPWSIYWIHFTGPGSTAWSRFSGQVMAIERGKNERINDRKDLFEEIFRNLDRGFSIETLEYVNLSLPHLLASFTHLNQFRLIREPGEKDVVGQSINFMLENIRNKYKLADLAKVVRLSASHYSHLFLLRTGHSPIDYFIQLKIQRACRLLDTTDLPISEVAAETGFEDQFYFSRQFKKVMNMSPREYRKR